MCAFFEPGWMEPPENKRGYHIYIYSIWLTMTYIIKAIYVHIS